MKSIKDQVRLFGMTTLQIESSKKKVEKNYNLSLSPKKNLRKDNTYYPQFDEVIRNKAKIMSEHYEVFYCLENSIRQIIREVMTKNFGNAWWENAVDQNIKQEVQKRIQKDQDSGFTLRSEDNLDFSNFGELSSIIEKQWQLFDDIFTTKNAMKKVMASLNTLRGPIAHCCDLAEDEILRLQLTIKDWFRLMS
ncbi:Swt1 family HEPN domain-containing protein [bacterium]|nr:Swt1 family HEPN domain-containing protein [bacterium]